MKNATGLKINLTLYLHGYLQWKTQKALEDGKEQGKRGDNLIHGSMTDLCKTMASDPGSS